MISYTIDRILEIVGQGAELVGAYDGDVKRIASLSDAGAGDLSFLGNRKYRSEVANSSASVILLPKNYTGIETALATAFPSALLSDHHQLSWRQIRRTRTACHPMTYSMTLLSATSS